MSAAGLFDRVVAYVALVLLAPVVLLIAAAVRFTSPGPVIYRQTRIGQGGRPFSILKFRTMVDGADRLAANVSPRGDPRITPVGGFLRHWYLDELPQLVNVLRGQMSLVGPRPSLPDEVALMDDDTLRRFAVRPGMTGLWQVSGRSNLGWHQAKVLDSYYADNWTITGDLMILLRTAKAVVTADGAC